MTKKTYHHLGTFLWVLAAVFAILPSWPHIYYHLSPQVSEILATTIGDTITQDIPKALPTPTITSNPSPTPTPTKKLPPTDPSLPSENGLIINKIGVKGALNEGDDWQKILRKGLWRVPNFATPLSDDNRPIIIAAHRWGYLEWSAAFRKLNSFYNLPKLQAGDKIEIIWDQRKFEYEVYSVQTGTEIPEYNTDLILYTCQLWNSPVRFFVFANRVN